ncbi:MAG: hypothetical protein M0042_08565 [Nitrospiraceae bacterium]|nr:hypothetical protein [Nitrospiraceae bacterium]
MHIDAFFHSWVGMFVTQSILHTLVAALIVDTALSAWNIANPAVRQRFRLLVVILPVVTFPLYQAISPERGSPLFRLDAVLDVTRWFNLQLWGAFPLGLLFLAFCALTSALFAFQELLPIIKHTSAAPLDDDEACTPEPGSPLDQALKSIPGPRPEAMIIDEAECIIFSSTGKRPVVYISRMFVLSLTPEELRAAVAHEIAHIRRSRRPTMVMLFLLRSLLFFNPVILMEFRRIIQEEEKICDDFGAALSGRSAMAQALVKFRDCEHAEQAVLFSDMASPLRDRIVEYGQSVQFSNRIDRLEENPAAPANSIVVFCCVLATIVTVNYYLV